MLFLEGVITQTQGQPEFNRVKAPSHSDMERVVNTVSHRIAQYLEKAGLIQRDIGNTFEGRAKPNSIAATSDNQIVTVAKTLVSKR